MVVTAWPGPATLGPGFCISGQLIYNQTMDIPTAIDLASSKGGDTFTLSYADVSIDQTIVFDENNWSEGTFNDVSFTTRLEAEVDTGGTWDVAIPLSSLTSMSKGIYVTYAGEGVTVSYSTNYSTWTTVGHGRSILEDVPTTGLFLYMRVVLADGDSYLERLQLDLLSERIMQPFSGARKMAFKGASMDLTPEHQSAFVADSGAYLVDGYLEIQPSQDDASVRAVEAWIRVDDTAGRLLTAGSASVTVSAGSYTFTGVTAYRNGVAVSNGAFPSGTWAHYLFVLATPVTDAIRLGDQITGTNPLNMSVGHVAVYTRTFTAAEALRQYNFNMGIPLVTVSDVSRIRVLEDSPTVDIYAYLWTAS